MSHSIPGSGHNHPPRDWLDVLRDLIRKLRGWLQEAVRLAVRLVTCEALIRRVDTQLADDLARVERHPALTDEEQHAVARAAAIARGDVR
jgi:hypothetical protein